MSDMAVAAKVSVAGMRPTRVFLRSRAWSSGTVGSGTAPVTTTELLPRPKVEGTAGDPMLLVRSLSPPYVATTSGGMTPAQLIPADAAGSEYYYVVQGIDGVDRAYTLITFNQHKIHTYVLTLQALDRAIPF